MSESTAAPRTPGSGVPSGIAPVDREWGGFYRGGAYLAYGRAASGRGLITLRFVAAGLERGDRCLFVASERFRDLAVEASSIGLDLRGARERGLVRLTRVPPMVSTGPDEDEVVARALGDLSALIRREQPERVVVNDFLPFVMFRSFDRFRRAFVDLLESLDGVDSTLLLALPEPANDASSRVVDFVSAKVTGTLHVEPFEYDPGSPERRLTLSPHVGHLGGRVVCRWDLPAVVLPPSGPSPVPGAGMPAPEQSARRATVRRQEPVGPAGAPPAGPMPEEPPVLDVGPIGPTESPQPEEGAAAAESPTPVESPTAAESPTPVEPSPGPGVAEREEFRDRLRKQFERRERGGAPFLLLAMRLDRVNGGATRPFDFEFIIDLVQESLRPQDRFLVVPDLERLVVWLADSTSDDAQDFFARLRRTLEAEAPQRAGQLLHAVSAIVVPDGRPFETADEFLAYALDED